MKDPLTADKSSIEASAKLEHSRAAKGSDLLNVPAAADAATTTATVYAKWAKFVWLSLQRLGVRRADLDDVCHDVFIVVQRKLPEFDQRSKLQTWLFGICTRVAANYRRRAYIRYENLAGGLEADGAITVAAPEGTRPDQQVAKQRSLLLAEGILNRMSPVKRTVFVMFELEGMNCLEIAEELGLPVGTVYSRLHGARKLFLAESGRIQARSGENAMTEPTRLLLDANAPEEAAALLRSLSAPTPPSAAKQAELAQQLASLASAPTAVAAVGIALWLKAAAVVLALGVVALWVSVKLRAPEAPRVIVPGSNASASVPPAVSASAPVSASAAVVAAPADTLRDAPVASAHPRPVARDTLADEEALLEQARRLAGASPSQALALLQQHRRRFPAGQLAAERMFLSVDVLTRLGNTDGARKQAEALMRAFPSSVYAAQVRARTSNPG